MCSNIVLYQESEESHSHSHSVIKPLANEASFSKKLEILCTFTTLVEVKSGYFLQSFVAK